MELILANTGSYPRVGDTLEYQSLRRTIAQWEKGEQAEADLRAAEDWMTESALRDQIDAGLDLVTDGLIRWYDPVSHLAGKLDGIEINGLLRFFDTNFYFRQPVVHSKPEWTKPLVLEEFLFAQAKSSRPVKPVLTGPLTLARLSLAPDGKARGFEKLLEGYTEALAREVRTLAAAGATVIQVDEPALLKHPDDFSHVERSTTALAAQKGSARIALTLYFGDPAPIYEKLQNLPIDVLGLDFTYNPGLVKVVAGSGSSKALALGLVDGRNTSLEDPTTVARQLEQLMRSVKSSPATLNPSCGLEYLPRDRAHLKLKHLVTIKETFLGSDA